VPLPVAIGDLPRDWRWAGRVAASRPIG